jgi:hypothetical protein
MFKIFMARCVSFNKLQAPVNIVSVRVISNKQIQLNLDRKKPLALKTSSYEI